MTINPDSIQFTQYSPGHFAQHLPFAQRGHLFTVPGTFPETTPAHTNVTDWEMAVYRAHGEWEARDVNGNRRVWGTGPTRRVAAGLAFQEIARQRHIQAAEIGRRRVDVLGLEEIPPYEIEVTSDITLIVTATTAGRLVDTEPGADGEPTRYIVRDPDTGDRYTVEDDGQVHLQNLRAGLLHIRCTCAPAVVARYETESDALAAVREKLTTWTTCARSLGAPDARDQQTDDETRTAEAPHDTVTEDAHRRDQAADEGTGRASQEVWDRILDGFETAYLQAQAARVAVQTAGLAAIGQTLRDVLPATTGITVRLDDLALTEVRSASGPLWTEGGEALTTSTRMNVSAFVADVLTFGCDEEVLVDLGWTAQSPGQFGIDFQ